MNKFVNTLCATVLFGVVIAGSAMAQIDPYRGCQSRSAIHPSQCYGVVTGTCSGGLWTYSVTMNPGYKFGALIIFGGAGQTLTGSGRVDPGAFTAQICNPDQINWSVPSSQAVTAQAGFKIGYNNCNAGQLWALHVIPDGGLPTFFAQGGCGTSPTKHASWGAVRHIYR